MPRMSRWMLALVSLGVAACGDHGGNYAPNYEIPAGPTARIQVLHASPDAPRVDVLIDGRLAISGLDYGHGTGEQALASNAAHLIAVQAETPGAPTTVIGPTSLSLLANTDYVIVAEGPIASIGPVIFSHLLAAVPPASVQVEILHAAPNAPAVAVYVTAPGADLGSSTPFGTVAFQGSLGPEQIPAGAYEIRVTPADAVTPVLFDSGTITLGGGSDLVIAALQNTGPGAAPITLGVVDAAGNNSRILDVATPTNLRFVNASPNAPPLSVITNGNASTPLVPSLAFESFTPYVSLTAAPIDVAVTPASTTSDELIHQTLNGAAGSVHSFYAVGDLASIEALVTRDDDRRLATQAKLRIIHAAPSAGLVDIYLTAPGASLAALSPTYPAVPFGADTEFVSYAAGSYDVTITAAGSKTAAIGPLAVTLANKGLYTAVARDAPGGGAPLGVLLLDDFAATP